MRQTLFALLAGALIGWGSSASPAQAAEDYEGLPEGLGREAVYFNCTACHSIRQVTQQNLSRESWDEVIELMVETNGMHPLQPWARTMVLNYLASHYGEEDEDWQGLPPGAGREEVFYLCQACHSLALVKQQGLSRDSWEETLDWMVEEQAMPEPEPEERALLLDYLALYYGIDRAAAGN
jgi:cytochrome c